MRRGTGVRRAQQEIHILPPEESTRRLPGDDVDPLLDPVQDYLRSWDGLDGVFDDRGAHARPVFLDSPHPEAEYIAFHTAILDLLRQHVMDAVAHACHKDVELLRSSTDVSPPGMVVIVLNLLLSFILASFMIWILAC